ncbi:MAG: TetR/AcrR family transcriptional regulator C-terminal ligand-binding domain-containing protein [Propionicimonas sp.]
MSLARRPRRTNTEVKAAITAAVLAELNEVGFAGLTFEGVARRAALSKAVLYRRHPTRVSLALGALQETAQGVYAEPPMTGSLRTDLLSWLGTAEAQVPRVGAATFRGLVGEASQAELEHVGALMAARAHDVERCIIEPARQRGEIAGDIPAPVTKLFFTLLRDQTLFGRPDDHTNTAIVDDVMLPLLTGNAKP